MDTIVKEKLNLKYSNVDWCGNIPMDWRVEKIKAHFNLSKERASAENNEILSLTQKGIKIRDISGNEGQMAASYDNYAKLRKGDIVLNPMDLISGYVDLANQEGIISPAYTILRKKKTDLNLEYAKHFFQWHYMFNIFFPFGKGVSVDHRWTLANDVLLNFPILIPPAETQEKIADFLNKKTKNIDKVIGKKRKLIDLMREERVATITKAVSKGIEKCSECADEHWEQIRLKYLANGKLCYGANEEANESNPEDPRFIRITDIRSDGNLRNDVFKSLPVAIAKDHMLKSGDILFARSGATVGKTFKYKESWGACCFAGYLIRISPKIEKIDPNFLYYFTQSNTYLQWKDSIFIQATIQNISAEKYNNLVVCYPNLISQKRIVSYLDKEVYKIDCIIEKTRKQIKMLQEYRASLIYNAVTGKIKI